MYIINQCKKIVMEASVVKSKFRGCLIGALLGDCLGAPYEGDIISRGDKVVIQRYFDKLEDKSHKGPFKKYTDDTAMTKSVAKFLIDRPNIDYQFLAKSFVEEYYQSPRRGYGQNVISVFEKLKTSKYDNIFRPAREQFEGKGSYGNGGAMRIAPVALCFRDDYKKMLEVAKSVTEITHSNCLGVNGALLQCIAIQQAFFTPDKEEVNVISFISQLREKIRDIETPDSSITYPPLERAYQEKIKFVDVLLERKYDDELDDGVIEILGNGISAYESVLTAIYCFLRAYKNDIPEVQTDNLFRRTIQYAITLGGDTDTIASMAGAIAGAYVGEDKINQNLIQQCEFHDEIVALADQLYETSISA